MIPDEFVTDTPPEQCPAYVVIQMSRHRYVLASFLTHERRFSCKAGQSVEVVIFHRLTPQKNFRDILAEVAKRRRDVPAEDGR
jgi:hypothetical protein